MSSFPTSSLQPPASTFLLDSFRRDRARSINDDIALGLRPAFTNLLSKLGNPHLQLPPVIHVAGTNGKGSTCAYLRSILEAADYRVHVYTSPHLVTFHERIRISGKLISEDELVELLQTCTDLVEPGSVTYFEAATAVAFKAFARHPADFTILEVGLGGRLDATNVIPTSLATIITRLSMDHRDYLGDTSQDITHEKAGIMRPGVACFTALQTHEALDVLQAEAKRISAKLRIAEQDWHIEKSAGGCRYNDQFGTLDLPLPALPGKHQIQNAGLAIATLRNEVPSIRAEAITEGLQSVSWPARLQRLTQGALTALLSQGSELWLDGGHNDSAGEVLAQQAAAWQHQDALPLHLVLGMLTTKHPDEFLCPQLSYLSGVQTLTIENEVASFTSETLADFIRRIGFMNVAAAGDVRIALKNLAADGKPKRILICGSLYLTGQVLKQNETAK